MAFGRWITIAGFGLTLTGCDEDQPVRGETAGVAEAETAGAKASSGDTGGDTGVSDTGDSDAGTSGAVTTGAGSSDATGDGVATSSTSSADEGSHETAGFSEGDVVQWRVMTFNMKRFAEGTGEQIAAVIAKQDPHFVALQEVDMGVERSGGVMQAEVLGELTGMHWVFIPAIPFQGGEYGQAVLSKFPIVDSRRIELPSGGEQRILGIVDIELGPGLIMTIGTTHLALDAGERVNQAHAIMNHHAVDPLSFLMGDMNSTPGDEPIEILDSYFVDAHAAGGEGLGFTHPAIFPFKRIDFIFADPRWQIDHVWVPNVKVSDHRPVVTLFTGTL